MQTPKIPHTYVIIFFFILISAFSTWIIPDSKPQTWQIFEAFYNGFVDKSDIIVFILIIGGAFWIVNDSKAFDMGIIRFLQKAQHLEKYAWLRYIGVNNCIITSIMLLFSIFGAVFGMSEETIAFCLVLVPMSISMGYDSITGVCMVFVAAGLGFAGAILNPFTIGIAQGLADIPLFSGIEYRVICWFIINIIGFTWVLRYANKIKKNPKLSPVYKEDQYWRDLHNTSDSTIEKYTPKKAWLNFVLLSIIIFLFAIEYPTSELKIGNHIITGIPIIPILLCSFIPISILSLRKTVHYYILTLLFFCIFFLIVGVMGYQWYIKEIAALFLGLGLSAGMANNKSSNEIVHLFIAGSKDILSAAMVVGLAGGIIVILQEGEVINKLLHSLANSMEGMGKIATIGMMYIIQTFINIIIPSGSAKAALTMPIMAPFSDLIGLSRQATVMAFQFGDGFTNMITPTSGVLIAVLGVARIPYSIWFKWVWKFMLLLILIGFVLLIPTVIINLNGF